MVELALASLLLYFSWFVKSKWSKDLLRLDRVSCQHHTRLFPLSSNFAREEFVFLDSNHVYIYRMAQCNVHHNIFIDFGNIREHYSHTKPD